MLNRIYTIGHSTRTLAELVGLLRDHGVTRLADIRRFPVMCAEAVPWRCHRNLLSDDLLRRGMEVLHILGPGPAQPHVLSEMARIDGDRVIDPPPQSRMF